MNSPTVDKRRYHYYCFHDSPPQELELNPKGIAGRSFACQAEITPFYFQTNSNIPTQGHSQSSMRVAVKFTLRTR